MIPTILEGNNLEMESFPGKRAHLVANGFQDPEIHS
jgi:hypothetical protein